MRSRNIKPGFFVNDQLAACDPLARLLFIGLWCAADRDGRIEDRPTHLRGQIFPFDPCDVNALLDQLAAQNLITRYSVNNARYVAVSEFKKHQHPHPRENPSTIPPPPEIHKATARHDQDVARHGPAVDEQGSAGLIPDVLIPDVLNARLAPPVGVAGSFEPRANDEQQAQGYTRAKINGHTKTAAMSVRDVIDLWHEVMPELPRVKKLTPARESYVRARIREDLPDAEAWRGYFAYIRKRPFLMGRAPPAPGHERPFRPSLFWFCKAENYAKCLEGAYQ